MGRIERLKSLTMARIEAFLASLESPETILPRLEREMADRVSEAARAEAKALSAVRADRRRLDAASGRVSRLQDGAMLAVRAGKLDTARQAIAAQLETERQVECCRDVLSVSEAAYESASDVRQRLQEQLTELTLGKKELLSRVRLLREQQRTLNKLHIPPHRRVRSLLDQVAQMEMVIEAKEAELQIQDQIRQTLGVTFQHERVRELENDAEVDRRLQVLRDSLDQPDIPK